METTWITKDQLCLKGIFKWNSQTTWLSDLRGNGLFKKENGIRKEHKNLLKYSPTAVYLLTHPIFEQEHVPYKCRNILLKDCTNTEYISKLDLFWFTWWHFLDSFFSCLVWPYSFFCPEISKYDWRHLQSANWSQKEDHCCFNTIIFCDYCEEWTWILTASKLKTLLKHP